MADTEIDTEAFSEFDWGNLNDLVHEQASELASNTINAGEQIEWLLLNGWTREDIASRLREMGSPQSEDEA